MKKTILPILLFIYIVADTIMKKNGVELCSSTGCEMAGQLLRFDSTYLNYLGALGALTLALFAFLKWDKLFTWLSATMVIFESLLIASQLNLNPEVCKFCLGVYAFLWLILITANRRVALYTTAPAIAVFIAFSILAIPKNRSILQKDGLYLIASKTCPHCKKTKEFLNKEGIKYKVLKATDINNFYFAKSLNITKIPIAIDAKGGNFSITVGDRAIIQKYSKSKNNTTSKIEEKPEKVENQGAFQPKINFGGDEGCTYSPTAVPEDCESDAVNK